MRTLMLALLLLGGWAFAQEEQIYSNSYKGTTPPELETAAENWLNSESAHTLESLRGRLVYIEFSFLR